MITFKEVLIEHCRIIAVAVIGWGMGLRFFNITNLSEGVQFAGYFICGFIIFDLQIVFNALTEAQLQG